MLARTLQPSLLSLFSSTSSNPLLLATSSITSSLQEDSFISLLDDSTDSNEEIIIWHGNDSMIRNMKGKGKEVLRGNIVSKVLHIQSPGIKNTRVKWGSSEGKDSLSIKLPYLHFSIKDLNQSFFLDVSILDDRNQVIVLRFANWLTEARYHPPSTSSNRPLYIIPLKFPPPSPHLLTPWTTLSLHFPSILSSCSQLSSSNPIRFNSIQSISVHANIRLKRIWCSEDREGGMVDESMAKRGMKVELALFAQNEVEVES